MYEKLKRIKAFFIYGKSYTMVKTLISDIGSREDTSVRFIIAYTLIQWK